MKTPEQIRDMEFQNSTMGGYKKNDVDLFLEEVASEIEILMKQKLEADRKLQEISKKSPEAALSSAGIQNVLVSAHRVAEQLTDDARHQAEAIIADANLKLTEAGMKGQEIIHEAEKNASLLGKTAEIEATKIIAEAVKKSEEIIAAAKESVELQQQLYDRFKIEVADFKKKAVTQCAAVLELLNQLPDEIPFNSERAKTVLSVDFNDPAALLGEAVEERVQKEKAEAEALAAAEIAKTVAEEQTKIEVEAAQIPAAELEAEFKKAHDDGAIPVATVPVVEEAVVAEAIVAEAAVKADEDEYQLTLEEAVNSQEESIESNGFVISEEAQPPIKKGRISFGDDDDDDDDYDNTPSLFRRKRR